MTRTLLSSSVRSTNIYRAPTTCQAGSRVKVSRALSLPHDPSQTVRQGPCVLVQPESLLTGDAKGPG